MYHEYRDKTYLAVMICRMFRNGTRQLRHLDLPLIISFETRK